MKQIQIQSRSPIEIHASDLLEAINDLREKYGDIKKQKRSIKLTDVLPKINLFKNRDAERGMLSFKLHYEDVDGVSCVRDFPNFGLEVESESKLDQKDQEIFLTVNVKVKAGKPKWQISEISECAAIFESGKFKLSLIVRLDETTEWGGHSGFVTTAQDTPDALGIPAIPASHFIVDTAGALRPSGTKAKSARKPAK